MTNSDRSSVAGKGSTGAEASGQSSSRRVPRKRAIEIDRSEWLATERSPVDLEGFAQSMADAFSRLISENVVQDAKAPAPAIDLFVPHLGGPRLDLDAAAVIAKRGLKAKAVEDWLRVAKVPKKGFYDGLHLSPSTLSRKRKDQALDAAVTERLLRQSELMVRAAEVFGESAATWMTKGHPLLGGMTPIDSGANEYGGIRVREILNAIEHGGVV